MQRKDLCAMVLFAVCSSPLGMYAGTPVLEPEKTRLRETVLSHHTQIQNLHVRFEVTDTTDPAAPSICSWEWAFSGEKRYRKSGWPYPQGSAPSTRWGLAVWDGKVFKNYDSLFDNGGVKTHYDPDDDENPPTCCGYSRQLGHFSKGTIPELFAKVSVEDWECRVSDDGGSVTFSTDDIEAKNCGLVHAWVFDLKRNCMISAYSSTIEKDGKTRPLCEMKVLECKEVTAGIWLPMRSHVSYNMYDAKDPAVVVKRLEKEIVVQEIKANEESIESVFSFEFPPGSQYYDYDLKATVVPHASLEGMQKSLDVTATDLAKEIGPTTIPAAQEDVAAGTSGRSDRGNASQAVPRRQEKRIWTWVFGLTLLLLGGTACVLVRLYSQ